MRTVWSMEYLYGPSESFEVDEFSEVSFGFLDTLSTEEINELVERLEDYVDNIVKH